MVKGFVFVMVAALAACGGVAVEHGGDVVPDSGETSTDGGIAISACEAWNAANPDVQVGTRKAYRYNITNCVGGADVCPWTPIEGSPPYDVNFVGCKTVATLSTGDWDLQCCP